VRRRAARRHTPGTAGARPTLRPTWGSSGTLKRLDQLQKGQRACRRVQGGVPEPHRASGGFGVVGAMVGKRHLADMEVQTPEGDLGVPRASH
jgi:hypothetical protein